MKIRWPVVRPSTLPHHSTMSSSTSAPSQGIVADALSKTAASYEHRVGHICRQVASQIAPLLRNFPTNGTLLDDACGTGAATEELLKVFPAAQVSAIDLTPPMIDAFKHIISQSTLLASQVRAIQVGDAQHLPYSDDSFDASIMNFGIFFLPDPIAGVKEIHRTLKPGGTTAITVFKSFGFKPILDEVQNRIQPVNRLTKLPLMGPWCDSTKLKDVIVQGGFSIPSFHTVVAQLWGQDAEDFKVALLESFGMFVARAWSEEEKAKLSPITSQVVDELLEKDDPVCLRDGSKVGCGGEAWVAIAVK